ncbi:TetR/AcrR family transcriptional regulator [Streptomyces sp. enrichment culture]|uniref:TetR/AcrR family transcriptional regulator n=1 Tax=Streptomyces sp. enrichment culture TaxID=1795815 RepID=UPI003F546D3D
MSERRGGGTPTRRRSAALENAITDVAWDVLVEHSYNGLTYEAVAARDGTSKPVLYRRWPQREDLLIATLTRYWRPSVFPTPAACARTPSPSCALSTPSTPAAFRYLAWSEASSGV